MLVHIGVQGLVTRGIVRDSDPKWIFVGCILPDVPWIVNRMLAPILPSGHDFDVRLYFIVQASLFSCALLAAALAFLSSRPMRVFTILFLGSLLHLLLDATQIKWGNGVHLFAPVSWEMLSFGWYWPEDITSYLLTGLGLAYFIYACWRLPAPVWDLRMPRGRLAAAAALCFMAYGLVPFALLSGPESADNHSVKTLRERDTRIGKFIALDRSPVLRRDGAVFVHAFGGEPLALVMPGLPDNSTIVSLQGRFLDNRTIEVDRLHVHQGKVRDIWSYIGLLAIAGYWIAGLPLTKGAFGVFARKR